MAGFFMSKKCLPKISLLSSLSLFFVETTAKRQQAMPKFLSYL